MNKTKLIERVSLETGYSLEQCSAVVNLLEKENFISKKNQDKIVYQISLELQISEAEANDLYADIMSIIKKQLVYKLKHPFGQ